MQRGPYVWTLGPLHLRVVSEYASHVLFCGMVADAFWGAPAEERSAAEWRLCVTRADAPWMNDAARAAAPHMPRAPQTDDT